MSWLASRRMVFGEGAALRIRAALLRLEGGRILEVRELPEDARGYQAALQRLAEPVEDFADRLVTPAFVNAHTHLALVFLRSFDARQELQGNLVEDLFYRFESRLQPGDVKAFARMGAYESLLHGVGFVWDHYYAGLEVAEALREVGLAGAVAPTLQDLGGPGAGRWKEGLEDTARLARDETLARQGVFAAVGPHATDTVSERLFQEAVRLAEAHDLPMHLHAAQSLEELQRAQAARHTSPLGLLEQYGVLAGAPKLLIAHALYASSEDLERLDPARHLLVFCPYSQLAFGFPAQVQRWSAAGIPWAVATDCAASNDSMNLQKELRLVARGGSLAATWSSAYAEFFRTGALEAAGNTWETRQAHAQGPAPAELLAKVWSLPGAAHPAARTGVLAPGALANLVIWDTHHPSFWPGTDPLQSLALADTSLAIHGMRVMGRPVGQDGDFHASLTRGADYVRARADADRALARLFASSA